MKGIVDFFHSTKRICEAKHENFVLILIASLGLTSVISVLGSPRVSLPFIISTALQMVISAVESA
jgi:hypothetical protein